MFYLQIVEEGEQFKWVLSDGDTVKKKRVICVSEIVYSKPERAKIGAEKAIKVKFKEVK